MPDLHRRRFLLYAGAFAVGCSASGAARWSAPPVDRRRNRYLQGPYAPVEEEVTLTDLEVTGSLPKELAGRYVRNGPDPSPLPTGKYDWFTGDGMLHSIAIEGGRARGYRNRWIRTEELAGRKGWPAPPGPPEPFAAGANAANTNIVRHAGRNLALYEVGLPHQVGDDLGTVGRYDFDGRLKGPMTAHPKLDPATGELHFFGYVPTLTYHVADADGRLVRSEPIDVGRISMMHDFSLTESSVVFYDLPVVFDAGMLATSALPFAWKPESGARIGVLRRGEPGSSIRWHEVEPSFVYHTLNAYDDGPDRLVLEVIQHESAFDAGDSVHGAAPREGRPLPKLHRWTVTADGVANEPLTDRSYEFPRVDVRRTGLPHRVGYGVGLAPPTEDDDFAPVLVQHDLRRGRVVEHRFPDGVIPGEPIFVGAGAGEDEGWVLSLLLDRRTDRSSLVVLDAADFGGKPVAAVHLPVRVPVGFHGDWFPADGRAVAR